MIIQCYRIPSPPEVKGIVLDRGREGHMVIADISIYPVQ